MELSLSSPVDTLVYSLHERAIVSVHDLLDAYATFTNRVTSHAHLLHDTTHPVLAFLDTHKDDLVRVLRRDVRRAVVDPPSTLSPSFTGIYHSRIASKQLALDVSLLCQHALCALTTIFRFPAFFSVFPERDLSSLFGEVLDISLADRLPGCDQIHSLSLRVLSCHRLPLTVLSLREGDIVLVLQRSLDETRQPVNIILEGTKTISHTLQHYSSTFFLPLSPLLPHVTKNLFSESHELRLHSSIALGKFASALVSQVEPKWHTLPNHIVSFLESYCDESQVAFEDTNFSRMIRATFFSESPTHPSVAPAQILSVLASLIVLCGPTLYEEPVILRFILQSLGMALKHKRAIIRALYPHVWRCLVWTFNQMLLNPESVEPTAISLAFHAIRQEVSGGIGIALVNVLLSQRISAIRSDERGERVSQALSVIKAMVQTECKHTRHEGFTLLQGISGHAQVRHQITQSMHEIPASVLLNGAIIGPEGESLSSTIHSIPKVPVTIHWLEESEIARNCGILLVIWKHSAIKVDKEELGPSLVDVWLSVLLAYSRQVESGHHVCTAEMLRSSAATIAEFLPSAPLESWDVNDQLYRLDFIDKLWSAMQQAFVSQSLTEPAELILTSVLKHRFHVLDLGVRASWGRLCASLMVTAPPSFLCNINDPTTLQLVIRTQRELWGIVAASSSSKLGLDQRQLVKFLVIPICSWVLSNPELKAWEALLRDAIAVSGDSTIVADILPHLQNKDAENWESIISVLGFLLTSHEHGIAPSNELLSVAALTCSLELLNVIRCVIASDPCKVMQILHVLHSSLNLWIEDRPEVMSDDEFNSVVVPLYCETLKILEALPLSIESLQSMEDFLASPFFHIPTPAIAPFAFEKFWRATYHGRSEFSNALPGKVKSCLSSFVAAYGGDLADGLSLTTESQSQSQSIIYDSQAHFPSSRSHQGSSPLSASTHAGPQSEVIARGHSSPIVEGQSEGSVRESQIRVSPIASPGSAFASPPYPEKNLSVSPYAPNQKRKLSESDGAPRKRSRSTRATLRAARKFESEPATRDVTPIDVPRMNSLPLRKRMVFDGVRVPTLRGVRRRQRAETSKGERDLVSTPQAPSCSSRSARRRDGTSPSALPPSVWSEEESFHWEDGRVEVTSSEIDIDQSLIALHSSSPPQMDAFAPHDPDEESNVLPGSSSPKVMSQGGVSPSAPPRPSLRRAKTTSARLDALRDVYSAVANGGSQLPMSELVQATKLVHQIGAVLTDQMGKKVGDR